MLDDIVIYRCKNCGCEFMVSSIIDEEYSISYCPACGKREVV